MPAKTKLNPKTAEIIIELVREGNFLDTAVGYAKVSKRSAREWIAKGRKNVSPLFREFFLAIEQARCEAEINDLRQIQAGNRDWTCYAWRLERRNWKHWGRKEAQSPKPVERVEREIPIAEIEKRLNKALASMTGLQDETAEKPGA